MSEILGDKLNIVYEDTLLEITPELMKKTIIKQNKEIERLKDLIRALWNNNYTSNLNDKQLELLDNIIFDKEKDNGLHK